MAGAANSNADIIINNRTAGDLLILTILFPPYAEWLLTTVMMIVVQEFVCLLYPNP